MKRNKIEARSRERVLDDRMRAACTEGNLNAIVAVLEEGLDMGQVLDFAAHTGQLKIMEYVLNRGCSPNCHKNLDYPINAAVDGDQVEAAELLISRGASLDRKLLAWDAARIGNPRMVELLVRKGAKFQPDDVSEAVEQCKWQALEVLVRHGVDLKKVDEAQRENPIRRGNGLLMDLFCSCCENENDRRETAKILCAAGVQVDPKYKERLDKILA